MKRLSFPWRRAALGGIAICMLASAPPGRPGAAAQSKKHRNSVAYRNVALEFDGTLSKEYVAETVAAVPLENPADKPDGVAPQHIVITLRDSYAARLRRDPSSAYALPQVFVFPTSDPADPAFDRKFPTVRRAAGDLKKLLGRRGGSVMGSIPFLPWGDERQLLIARKRPIRFRNGRGLLFLTQYDQEESPINNTFLVYTFQGLTDDNAWYVSAVFPVSAQGLPASGEIENQPAFRAGYGRYVRTMTEKLNRLPVKRFTPGLALLEEMIRSLKVGQR
jgi:hypothetical protein